MGDSMADVDFNVGLILNQLKELGIEDNTLVIWCTDNGAEMRRPWRGSPGPFRGYYNSAMEGGVRTPAVIRWPNKIKAGQVSNEMIHEVDLFTTIINATGSDKAVPKEGSGSPVKTYTRSDRAVLKPRSVAMENPDFSGTWSTTVLHRVSVINRTDEPAIPTLGSGWGDKISIKHTPDELDVERVVFIPRDFQQLVRYQS